MSAISVWFGLPKLSGSVMVAASLPHLPDFVQFEGFFIIESELLLEASGFELRLSFADSAVPFLSSPFS